MIPDVKNVNVIMENLAKFHGIWLSWMKNPNPKEIAGLNKESLLEGFEMMRVKHRDVNDFFLKLLKSIEEQMIITGKPLEIIKAFHRFRKSDLTAYFNNVQPKYGKKSKIKLLTMVHGDFWTNNIFVTPERTQV